MTELKLGPDVFWREAEGEVVGLEARSARYFAANRSAAVLWSQLEEGTTEERLVATLCERYGVPRDTAESDVAAFVALLRSRKMLAG